MPLFSQEEELSPGRLEPEQTLEVAKRNGSVVAFDPNRQQIAPPVNGDAEYYGWVFITYAEGPTHYHVEWGGGTKKRTGTIHFIDVYVGSRYKQKLAMNKLDEGANWDDYDFRYNHTLAFVSRVVDVPKDQGWNWMWRVVASHAWYPYTTPNNPLWISGTRYHKGIPENKVKPDVE
ncbi:MAG: hypothetical protein RMJ34_03810 [candidate division WOR-3 bacterium]|nr:hypothetical protein [candidate division WOR-3 bacterium]MDW8114045.1 hypothetical protein [candidate division WOR-3 bacterium]